MAEHEHVERKLAAILAADVVNYSRLMGTDEVGTLRALKAVRKKITHCLRRWKALLRRRQRT